ncbi:hypothetical protein K0U27_11315 [archaeon]|nr:hypothetical protein [archaeon]
MMQNSDSSFAKMYYPLILIAIGSFFLLFPFGEIGGEYAFYIAGIIGFTTLIIGIVLYYQKRTTYSPSLRKKMKILGILLLVSVAAIPLIGVGMGIAIGLGQIFYDPSRLDYTEDIDSDLLETRIIDWVNTNRAKGDVGGLNIDDALNSLAKLRSTDMASVSLEQAEFISDLDVNLIAKDNNLECIIGNDVMEIQEYVLFIPHSKFVTIESMVNFVMEFLIEHEPETETEILFNSDFTLTGIHVSMNDDYLMVVQNFC